MAKAKKDAKEKSDALAAQDSALAQQELHDLVAKEKQDFQKLVEQEREHRIPASFRAGEAKRKGNHKRALVLEKVADAIRAEMREQRGMGATYKPQTTDGVPNPVAQFHRK